jgi:gamma-tubulin complex component 4
MANASTFHHTFVRRKGVKGLEGDGEVRRHMERLLLRLDFNEGFSKARFQRNRHGFDGGDILRGGELA